MLRQETETKYVTREQWGARKPKLPNSRAVRQRYFKVHWTVTCVAGHMHDQCDDHVRGIQNYHMDTRGWNDIAYGELICPHGYVYEGRGPGRRSAANGNALLNSGHEAISVIGGPACNITPGALNALTLRLRDRNAEEVKNHSDGYSTSCPGPKLTQWVNNEEWKDKMERLTEIGPAYWAWKGWRCSTGPWKGLGREEKGAEYRPRLPGKVKMARYWSKFRAQGGCR